MAFREGLADLLETGGSTAMAGAPLGGPAAPWLLGGGAAANLLGRWIRPEQQQPEDPYADMRQQAIQGLQEAPPEINIENLQNMLRQNLEQRIIPGIAHRFSGMGAGGQRSSGFARTIGSAAGSELQKLGALLPQLQNRRFELNQNRLGALLGALGGERQFAADQQTQRMQQQQARRDQMNQLLRNVGQTFGDIERTDVQREDVATRRAALALEQERAERLNQQQNPRDLNRPYQEG